MKPTLQQRLDILELVLHEHEIHPDYNYRTETGPRKAWDGAGEYLEPEGWVLNPAKRWERFDYHEEEYWMRPKALGGDDE